ncbi:MAG: Na+:solute symporter [Pirellulales bacterium]
MHQLQDTSYAVRGLTSVDYAVLVFYVLGIFLVGVGLSGKVKNTGDLFKAGGKSPWWASGISGFMTMFSAGTFVVWGGIAYRHGFVAVFINLMYGVAALLVGWFVAGRWKRISIETPAEFIEQRYGRGPLHLYTWAMMIYRMTGTGVALYSLAILLVSLMWIPSNSPFAFLGSPNQDGTLFLRLDYAIIFFGGSVVVYTMVGGLWAVLMTDVLQFIVLNLAVVFMIPLILAQVGGVSGFVSHAPDGFFLPVAGPYTWFFLAGWCAIHFFMIGAEWAFVQRFICVPSEKDARKSAYLFGALYLVSPILWLAPPLAYRVMHPIPQGASESEITALAESAYIMACNSVLPVGMIGLMLAAMFSATASMVSSQLNVFAGVLTEELYSKVVSVPSDRHLLWAGRGFSLVLGIALVGLALVVPILGGAEKVVIAITALMVTPLLAPTIFGLFSRRMNAAMVWWTVGICIVGGACATGLPRQLADILQTNAGISESLATAIASLSLQQSLASLGRGGEILTGVVLPVVLLVVQWGIAGRRTDPGWLRVEQTSERQASQFAPVENISDPTPAYIVSGALVVCGLMMALLIFFNDTDRLLIMLFSVILWGIAGVILWMAGVKQKTLQHPESSNAKA